MSEALTYPTCSTCKHWTAPLPIPPTWGWEAKYGECSGFIDTPDDARPALLEEAISTLPSFGCLLHSDLTEAGA